MKNTFPIAAKGRVSRLWYVGLPTKAYAGSMDPGAAEARPSDRTVVELVC